MQCTQAVPICIGDGQGRIGGEATTKDGQAHKYLLDSFCQALPGELKRRPNATMTFGHITHLRLENIDPPLDLSGNMVKGKAIEPSCRQLNGQWHTGRQAANLD